MSQETQAAAERELSPNPVNAVTRILPPSRILSAGRTWMKLEKADRIRERYHDTRLITPDIPKHQRVYLRLVTTLWLILLRLLWLPLWILDKKRCRAIGEIGTAIEAVYRRGVEPPPSVLPETMDEIEAKAVIKDYQRIFAHIEQAYSQFPEILAYLAAFRSSALRYGEKLADAYVDFREARMDADKQGERYRSNFSNMAAMMAGGMFVYEIAASFIFFLLPWVKFWAADPEARSLVLTTIYAIVGAIFGFVITLITRLFLNHRRMRRIEKDTQLRIFRAELVRAESQLAVLRECWIDIASAYRTLTGEGPPPDAISSYEDRVGSQKEEIARLEEEVRRLETPLTIKEKLGRMVDSGSQGDVIG